MSIRKLLTTDPGKAIEVLETKFEQTGGSLYNDIILQSGRWNSLQNRRNNGTISEESGNLEENRIRAALNALVDRYERDHGAILVAEPAPVNGQPPVTPAPTVEIAEILFISAVPTDQGRLETDREYREIRAKIREAAQRDFFKWREPEFAATVEDFILALNNPPDIIHFSGHGLTQGICIANENNQTVVMQTSTLTRLFKRSKDKIRLVVLNSCYSADQAKTISALGLYVAGMQGPIGDPAARNFAKGLYLGLGAGKPMEEAFEDALIVVETLNLDEANKPEFWKNGERLVI